MKMIKRICTCLCMTMLFLSNTISYAQEDSTKTPEKKIVTLTFYTDENTMFETVSGENGAQITTKTPIREGYLFRYWKYEKDGKTQVASHGYIFEEDTKFYAVWDPQMQILEEVMQNMEDAQKKEEQRKELKSIQRRRPVVSAKKTKGNTTTISVDATKYEKDGYEIQYSTSKKFKKVKTITVESTKKKLDKKIKNLKKGKTYYIRVRAYRIFDPAKYNITGQKETFYSNWSRTTKITVKK